MDEGLDLSRREFMQVGAVGLTAGTGNLQIEGQPRDDKPFRGSAFLIGPESALPAPDDPFFDNKSQYHYIYQAIETGARYEIKDTDSAWSQLRPCIVQKDNTLYFRKQA